MEESETDTIVNGSEAGEEKRETFFEIPTLPSGSLLTLRLLSNWGDSTFIGLTGVEVFLESGRRAQVTEVSTSASSHEGELKSVGDLSAFGKSSWRAHLQQPNGDSLSQPPTLSLALHNNDERVAMLRIWNYSESRVHATRGVREVEIDLDGSLIFRGLISPAFDGDNADIGETILFTTSDSILEAISENDVCLLPQALTCSLSIRPNSAVDRIIPQRPITAEQSTRKDEGEKRNSREKSQEREEFGAVRVLHLTLDSTWGIREVIGLTGIEFFDCSGESVPASLISTVTVDGTTGDDVYKLINGRNLSRSKDDMWLSPFDPANPPTINFTFLKPLNIAGVSIWNYNASVELTYAGARNVRIHSNGKTKRRVVLRKAIGYVYFDFVQDVSFDRRIELGHAAVDRPMSKCANGFIYQLCLLSTWGDEFYVGLNGIELRDDRDRPIVVKANNLAAFPESVNILPQVRDDPRRSENLINGVNEELSAVHSWLTPLLPNRCARVFFIFDIPTFVTKMIIYNYRKTPTRGVRHLSISVDDDIVWSGEIPVGSIEDNGRTEIVLRESSETA